MSAAVNRIAARVPVMAGRAVQTARPKLATFWRYAKVELKPPMPGEFGQVTGGIRDLYRSLVTGRWKTLTMKEATLNTLIGMEIVFCFFIGEAIGRGHLIGYPVPGTIYTGSDMRQRHFRERMCPLRREWGVSEPQHRYSGHLTRPTGVQQPLNVRRHNSVLGVTQLQNRQQAVRSNRQAGSVINVHLTPTARRPAPLPPVMRTNGFQRASHRQLTGLEADFDFAPSAGALARPSAYLHHQPRPNALPTQPVYPPPPPYATMNRPAFQPPQLKPRRPYFPPTVTELQATACNTRPLGYYSKPVPTTGMLQPALRYPQQYTNGRGCEGSNPIDSSFQPQIYTNDVTAPSPQSVELEGLEGIADIDPPYILQSYSQLEVFVKIFALFSLLFPPTGIGAVVCAFTANKESSQRYRSARQKVSLILASVGFTLILFVIVVVIIATQVVK